MEMHATFWALVPPVVAILLALITKEVYSSLFIGIIVGGLFYSGFSFEGTVTHIFQDGMISVLSDSWNVGILIFLVILGIMVALMNTAGGSAGLRRVGLYPHQNPGRRPAGHRMPGCPDLHRRLFQLPDRRQRHAPGHRQAQHLPGQAGLPD